MRRDREGRVLRPSLERIESRELLSAITDIMIANSLGSHRGLPHAASVASRGGVGAPDFQTIPTNNAVAGPNLLLMPTGQLTRHEQRREAFVATFTGNYYTLQGRTSTEAKQMLIRGVGGSNQFLHGDIQLRVITPVDPNIPLGGEATAFDRNLNSNSSLGIDLIGSPQSASVDAAGRPTHLTWTTDFNTSAGVYVEALGQGTVNITYRPTKRLPGGLEQGIATVRVRGQLATIGTSFILANANINP